MKSTLPATLPDSSQSAGCIAITKNDIRECCSLVDKIAVVMWQSNQPINGVRIGYEFHLPTLPISQTLAGTVVFSPATNRQLVGQLVVSY